MLAKPAIAAAQVTSFCLDASAGEWRTAFLERKDSRDGVAAENESFSLPK
jgi:hypothetical protein